MVDGEKKMNVLQERALNQGTYRRIKGALAQTYPHGRFLGISGGQVVADADSLDQLCVLLRSQGRDPTQVLTVQAGVDHPETVVIFLTPHS